MATVAQIIARALRLCNAVSSGDTPTTQEYSDGLETLNGMIKSWSATRSAIYGPNSVTKALSSGVTSFTIGSGGDVDTTRPKEILSVWLRDTNNNDYILDVRNLKEYEREIVKNVKGIPEKMFVRKGVSLWTCYFDFVTDEAYTLYLELYQPLATYSVTTTTVALPGEYEDAYVYNLSVRLAPEYGKVAPMAVKELASYTYNNLKRANMHPVVNIRSNPFGGEDRTNIYTG